MGLQSHQWLGGERCAPKLSQIVDRIQLLKLWDWDSRFLAGCQQVFISIPRGHLWFPVIWHFPLAIHNISAFFFKTIRKMSPSSLQRWNHTQQKIIIGRPSITFAKVYCLEARCRFCWHWRGRGLTRSYKDMICSKWPKGMSATGVQECPPWSYFLLLLDCQGRFKLELVHYHKW